MEKWEEECEQQRKKKVKERWVREREKKKKKTVRNQAM